ncbi:ScbA/BarX family gamma-butyrolactone biosynthesis protein [Streptomyces sp. NPDC005395]|uniref:ScbA/BarX family gamma-butyrolactone biosynthesis protein n=1 Tax=Streptomyces sp. NPDC005395 TaxID=3157042 RepID=UPI0033A55D01
MGMQQCRAHAGPTGHGATAQQDLTFQQTIPRQMVHRAAVAEVFVTDAVSLGDDRFLVGAQWPRDHALYHPDEEGRSDPLLVAETIRQALVYLGHWHYGVPLTHRFVGRNMDFEITDADALRVGSQPLSVVLDARWRWVDSKPTQRFGMCLEVVLSVGGKECGRGSLQVIAVDDRRYELLRRRSGASACAADPSPARAAARQDPGSLDPSLVGRLRAKDSVIVAGTSPGQWRLRVDLDHAILFDHPTDHVPLMVILEGVRQLGYVLVGRQSEALGHRRTSPVLSSLAIDCLAFAELHEPVHLVVQEDVWEAGADRAAAGPPTADEALTDGSCRRRLRIQAVQGGRAVAVTDSTWSVPSGEPVGQRGCAAADEPRSGHGGETVGSR